MNLSNPKIQFLSAEVILNEKISDSAYHVSVQGEEIKTIDYTAGMHMKVVVGSRDDGSPLMRSYSIWDFDAHKGKIDIAVCTHSGGLGEKWIRNTKTGDKFYFFLKNTLLVDNSADVYFFVGDISTLGHFYKIRRGLSGDKIVSGFIYSQNEGDFFHDIDGTKPFNFFVWESDKFNPPVEVIKEKIVTTCDLLANGNNKLSVITYLGGNKKLCDELERFLKDEMKFEPEQVKMKSFWNPDKERAE